MAVPTPFLTNPAANVTPSKDGASVAYAAVQSLHGGPLPLDDVTFFDAQSLSALFGRNITALGLKFIFAPVNIPPIPPYPLPYGPESLADLLYQICTVQILLGRNIQQSFSANIFRDTKSIQRQLEIFIRPPMPEANDALKFRIFSPMPLPVGDLAAYTVTSIFSAAFPPNGSEPATLPLPSGLGLVNFG